MLFDKSYYENLMELNWYNPFEFWYFDFDIWSIKSEELQLKFLCHKWMDKFMKLKESGKKSIVTTWFWMSWSPHIWTISQLMRILKINEWGIDTQIVLGDLDAYCGKNVELKKVLEYTEKYKNFMGKLWYKNWEGRIIRDQIHTPDVLRTSYLAWAFMNDWMFEKAEEDLHDFYAKKGKVDGPMSYRRRTSLSLMIADFLDLWLWHDYLLWNKYNNVSVMLWVDEHQYVKFWQQTLENIKSNEKVSYFNKDLSISAIYTPIIKWFNNYPKQSKSFPNSSINADSSKDDIYNKIMHWEWSYNTPEDNVIYQMMCWAWNYSLDEYKALYDDCLNKWNNREYRKKEFVDYLIDILSMWNK